MRHSNNARPPSTPKTILGPGQLPSRKGFSPPRQRWDEVCKFCKGAEVVMGLKGWEPCQGCCSPRQEVKEQCAIDQIIHEWKEVEGGMTP